MSVLKGKIEEAWGENILRGLTLPGLIEGARFYSRQLAWQQYTQLSSVDQNKTIESIIRAESSSGQKKDFKNLPLNMPFAPFRELNSLVADKKVALVGPAPHLTGTAMGALIDEYDVVCRVNDITALGAEEDYGARTDISFMCCSTRCIGNGFLKYQLKENLSVTEKLKLLVASTIKAQHDWGGSTTENFEKVNEYNIPFISISPEKYWHYNCLGGAELNCGMFALMLLLESNIKSLLFTGFSFYSEVGDHEACHRPGRLKQWAQLDGVAGEKGKHRTAINKFGPEVLKEPAAAEGHDQETQRIFFKDYVLRHYSRQIIIDSFLQNLLAHNYPNILQVKPHHS